MRDDASGLSSNRVEVKNINSFKFVEKALESEQERISAVLDAGGYLPEAGHAADTALFLHLAARGARAWYIAERLEESRGHAVRSSTQTLADVPKSEEAVWTWQSVRFVGEAEQTRIAMLAEVMLNRARVLSLHGHASEARRAAARAVRTRPFRPKAWAALGLLCLPGRLRRALLAGRYPAEQTLGR